MRRRMSKGGEVEMKSCFQSSDKQGESGGNRGKGGTGLQKRGRHIKYTSSSSTTSPLPILPTFPPRSPQYFQLLINPHPSAETGMSLGWELKSTHNCPISHRGGNCNCTCVDRGGGVDRGRWQFTLGRVSSYSIFSALPSLC